MAADCTQEAILAFLKERGGKVKNTDLIEHFKSVFPEQPEKKAAARNRFKTYVDNVAFVKTESGVKYVCLKKKFRGVSVKETEQSGDPAAAAAHRGGGDDAAAAAHRGGGDDAAAAADPAQPRAAGGKRVPPGSGYGNDSQVRVPPHFPTISVLAEKTDDGSERRESVCVAREVDGSSGEMGNRGSLRREQRESRKEQAVKPPDIPQIAVIEASPLPAEDSMFTLPGPVQTAATGQVDTSTQVETESLPQGGSTEAEQIDVLIRRRSSKGSQHRRSRRPQVDEGEDETQSLSGSESSPKGSRRHFIEVMLNNSPQLRRSLGLRNSVSLSFKSDSDSLSLVSNMDDDRDPITLDPLEHEWMMCAPNGEWSSLCDLLSTDPTLVLRKDFITGFTCLHWAAKQDKPELMALIINFAKQHNVPVSVDTRSNTGYTPLHIAAMHNHMEVVKLLVGAYNADVEIRDYSGKKACQYLTDNVSVDMRDIIGAYERSESEKADRRDRGSWRFSKVLQSNPKPRRLLNPNDCDSVDGEARLREPPIRRKSSFSRMKPKLDRLRRRTSQIVHSVTFHDAEEVEGSTKGSFKSRPKTHFFG
ncbi:Ankyrin repeat domain-containing protein SOWAHC [Collichthys lucidus]|uniref:Ankyrin repeat domain-containing protein SOWAHC n=1 Tax=Collichthys lucidus TaxID=240159 RepID=A0A4U5TXZ2_COLLU|nr:Ankyrin repeat domain-containing protein SOWAHC [Collichthys lucidus]